VAATSLALIALKLGTKAGIPIHYVNNKLQFNFNFYTVAGVSLYGLSFLTYIYLVSKYDLGYIIPLTTALVYVVIFTASFFIFDEVFTATKIAGIALIVIGLALLNLKK
jgi:small multidrug resistance pump